MLCISIVTDDMWRQIKPGLIIRMQIDVPGTGIAFTVPLGSIGGKKVLRYFIQDHEYEKDEETTLKGTRYELPGPLQIRGLSM